MPGLASSSMCEAGENSADPGQCSSTTSTTKKQRTLSVLHVDMNDPFWQQRPHLLNGTK